jgi:hypothetical protein
MARDFEDVNNIDNLSDDELRGVVRNHLEAHNALDVDDFTIQVHEGQVILGGRVGTDGERLIAEHILTDVLGTQRFRNDVFVDPMRRAESPEAVDDSIEDDERREGLLLGDREVPMSAEAADAEPNLDDDLYGATDVHRAIADGTAWIPPESPTQEGLIDSEGMGENH